MSKKLSHQDVDYRPARSEGKRCDTCEMYIPKTKPECDLVKSPIRSYGYCDRWITKEEKAA